MQDQLKGLYERFRRERAPALVGREGLSSPLLVNPFPEYRSASHKIVCVGQCTLGWGGKDDDGYPRSFDLVGTFDEYARRSDSVDALMEFYTLFDFSRHQPNRASPFWQFYRRLLCENERAGVWTNLYRVDHDEKPPTTTDVLSFQHGLLREELNILRPDVVVFVTSHRNDGLLEKEMGLARRCPVSDLDEHFLCRFEFSGCSFAAFRTYHPKYLRLRRELDRVLEHLHRAIDRG